MSYMSRLGLWGAGTGFRNSDQFIDALTKAGVGAMELVAMDMKRRGVYLGLCSTLLLDRFDFSKEPV